MNITLRGISAITCLTSIFILGCERSKDSEYLGLIKLTSFGTSSLALKIARSYKEPYALQFESPGIGVDEINKLSVDDKLEVFLENNDVSPLTFYLNSKKANITIASKGSERIFTGTFKSLLLATRGG